MGNRISAEQNDSHVLVRDKEGWLNVYPYEMEDALKCSPLPVPLEEGVQYLFLPSAKYNNKNYHTHVYADDICDTVGNDMISPETTLKDKNMNHMKQTADSNAGYFQLNEFPINEPPYPKFYSEPEGHGRSRFAAQSAYSLCKPLPFPSDANSTFSYSHNGIPMSLFTDEECTNEYITHLPIPSEAKSFYGPYNVNNRTTENTVYNVPYTDVKTYLDPAQATSAKYYKVYKDYPDYTNE
jgi:hypothetical protein